MAEQRFAHVDPDDLELVWLLGEAQAPLRPDELAARTERWRPVDRERVHGWCGHAAGRDLVMLHAPGGEESFAALTAAGARLAARLRDGAAHDPARLRTLLLTGPATAVRLREHDTWERLGEEEAEDWLAFAAARGLVVPTDSEPPVWGLTALGRERAEAAAPG